MQIAQVGEDAGTLDTALERLAEFNERSAAFRNHLGTVLIYPAIVVVMAVAVSVLLMTAVVPNLLDSLQTAGRGPAAADAGGEVRQRCPGPLVVVARAGRGGHRHLGPTDLAQALGAGGSGIGSNCGFRSWAS